MSQLNKKDHIVIADFGVDRGSVKDSTKAEPFFQQWIDTFENDPDYWLEIEGYSDCVGVEHYNDDLRHRRAKKVFELFTNARSRVRFHKAAPSNDYLIDNGDSQRRAINRGVTIHFGKLSPPQPVPTPPTPVPKPKVPAQEPDTENCNTSQREALAKAFPLAKQMVRAGLSALSEPVDEALLKKYFGKDAVGHQLHIQENFNGILEGLNWGPTFACEEAGSWWCEDAYASVFWILGRHIHICPSAIALGDDFLARTIIHEAAHGFEYISGEVLCAGGCPPSMDTNDAEDNADSYGEFAGEAFAQSQ